MEDDADLRRIVARSLGEAGYEVTEAEDGVVGDQLASEGGFDAIVLDWMLPGMTGFEICARLRDAGDGTPVIMVTARDEVDDRITGLDIGADDYVVKPFAIGELLARLRSIIRRGGSQHRAAFTAGLITLDVRSRAVTVAGEPISLSGREFELLEYFMRNVNLALARATIEEHVWGTGFDESSNVLEVYVRRLRLKLRSAADQLITVRGFGYRLTSIRKDDPTLGDAHALE